MVKRGGLRGRRGRTGGNRGGLNRRRNSQISRRAQGQGKFRGGRRSEGSNVRKVRGPKRRNEFDNRRRSRGRKNLTAEDLDKDLDSYWKGKDQEKQTAYKEKLDADLDSYFKSAGNN